MKAELRKAAEALQRTMDFLAEEYKSLDVPFESSILCLIIQKILAGDSLVKSALMVLDDPVELPSNLQDDHPDYKTMMSMIATANSERQHLAKTYRSALEVSLGQSDHEETPTLVHGRDKGIQDGIDAPPPSEAAKYFVSEQEARPMQIGRPFETTGPPIFIYHKVFSKFKSLIDIKDPKLEAEDVATALRLIQAAAEGYQNEAFRREAILSKIEKLLGNPVGGAAPESGFRHDGVVYHLSPQGKVPILVVEMKNEIGEGGSDPDIQGAFSFRKL
ncbi:hypothetical protein FRC04_012250 [Tulasnella sp. 424]|nr:hypothetical protein FRC04_012250 [Tulasnella sp. 424]